MLASRFFLYPKNLSPTLEMENIMADTTKSDKDAAKTANAGTASAPPPQAPAAGDPLPAEIDLIKQRNEKNKADSAKRGDSEAARTGAQAVADAVTKVANEAVKAAAGAAQSGADLDFTVSGSPGGRFRIEGPARSFGTGGTVQFGGVEVKTDGWSAEKIYGKLPANVPTNCEVVVKLDENTERKGFFRG